MISALPLVALWQNVVPVFSGVKPLLTIVASGSSFLLCGVIFAQRHSVARLFFPGLRPGQPRVAHPRELAWARFFGWFPTLLWIGALLCVTFYFSLLNGAVERVAFLYSSTAGGLEDQPRHKCSRHEGGKENVAKLEAAFREFTSTREYKVEITCWTLKNQVSGELSTDYRVQLPNEESVQAILKGTPSAAVPYQGFMGFFFLGAFVCASSAFVLTGLKDYLQRELGLTDADLILNPSIASRKEKFDVAQAPGIYGIVEYSPVAPTLPPNLLGPYCAAHGLEPQAAVTDPSGRVVMWKHVRVEGARTTETVCQVLQVPLSIGELERLFRESAERTVAQEPGKRLGRPDDPKV